MLDDNISKWPVFSNLSVSPPSPSTIVFAEAMASPGHSPTDLQNHLYASFIEGSTADVALHIKGSWEAIYKLHRVVLIQAVTIFTTNVSTFFIALNRCLNIRVSSVQCLPQDSLNLASNI
jgi:hypothetical protein